MEHPFHVIKNLFCHRKTSYRAGWRRTRRTCSRCLALPVFSLLVGACPRFMIEVRPEGLGWRGNALEN